MGEIKSAVEEPTFLEGLLYKLRLFHDDLNNQIREVVRLREKFVSHPKSDDKELSKETSNEYVQQYPDVLEHLNMRLAELTTEVQELKKFI